MAATVVGTNTSVQDAFGTSHTVSLPADIQSGELLTIEFGFTTSGVQTPTGWVSFRLDLATGGPGNTTFVRIADGEEGASVAVTTSNSGRSTHIVRRISGHGVTIEEGAVTGGLFQATTVDSTETNAAPDSPNLEPGPGSQDYLWLTSAVMWFGDRTIDTVPADYGSALIATQAAGTGSRCTTVSAQRDLEAASENPGAWALTGGNGRWVARTLAIAPSEAQTEAGAGSSEGEATAIGRSPADGFFVHFGQVADQCLEDLADFTRLSGSACDAEIVSGTLRNNSSTFPGAAYTSPDTGSVNHYAEAAWLQDSGDVFGGVLCRIADANNFVIGQWSTGNYRIWTYIGGSLDLVVAESDSITPGDLLRLEVEDTGEDHVARLYGAGVLKAGPVSVAHANLNSATQAGLFANDAQQAGPWLGAFGSGALSSVGTGVGAAEGVAEALGVSAPTHDEHFASVVLLAPFNGADEATTAEDFSNSNHTLTFGGGAQISTAVTRFAGGSLACDGVDSFVEIADSADWHFGSGDFTIEGFFRLNAFPESGLHVPLGQWVTATGERGWRFVLTSSQVLFQYSTTGNDANNLEIPQGDITLGQFHFFTFERAGNTFRAYLGGVVKDTVVDDVTLHNTTALLRVGANSNATPDDFADTHTAELRITKGVARYNGAFTAPTAPFPTLAEPAVEAGAGTSQGVATVLGTGIATASAEGLSEGSSEAQGVAVAIADAAAGLSQGQATVEAVGATTFSGLDIDPSRWLNFVAASQHRVDVPHTADHNLTSAGFILVRLRVTSFTIGAQTVFAKGDRSYQLRRDGTSNNLLFTLRNASGTTLNQGSSAQGLVSGNVNNGQWHNFICEWDVAQNVSSLWQNDPNTAVDSSTIAENVNTQAIPLRFGAHDSASGGTPGTLQRWWNGDIAGVALGNRLLTAQERADFMNALKVPTDPEDPEGVTFLVLDSSL